MQLFVM